MTDHQKGLMQIRLEFGESKSKSFPWVLRLCRAFPSFKESPCDGMLVYSVTFRQKDLKSFEAIWCKVGGWQNTALYLNGKLICAGDLSEELRKKNCDFEYRSPVDDDQGQNLSKKAAHTRFLKMIRQHGIMGNPN